MSAIYEQPWWGVGRNFMTPTVLETGRSGDWAWELSTGEGFDREALYGTTFRRWVEGRWIDGWRLEVDPSKLFFDEREARRHIGEVIL